MERGRNPQPPVSPANLKPESLDISDTGHDFGVSFSLA
jgi:hypothetical protein